MLEAENNQEQNPSATARSAVNVEDLSEWIAKTNDSVLRVFISDPQTSKGGFNPVTTYAVTCECPGNPHLNTTVRRRYSDFEFLLNLLKKRYSGMILPSLPEKQAILKSERFIILRIRGLNRWFEKILERPFIKSDANVQEFLCVEFDEQSEGADMSQMKKRWKEDGDINWLERPHIRRWRDQLSLQNLPDTSEGIIAEMFAHFSKQKDALTKFLSAVQTSESKTNTQSQANDAFSNATANAEAAAFAALEKHGEDTEVQPEVLTAIKGIAAVWHELTVSYQNFGSVTQGGMARVYSDLLQVKVKETIADYNAALDTIGLIKNMRYSLTGSENALVSYENSLVKMREKRGDQDPKVESTVENIRLEKEKIASYRAEILAIQRALVCVELESFVSECAADHKSLLGSVASLQTACAAQRKSVWDNLATAVLNI